MEYSRELSLLVLKGGIRILSVIKYLLQPGKPVSDEKYHILNISCCITLHSIIYVNKIMKNIKYNKYISFT